MIKFLFTIFVVIIATFVTEIFAYRHIRNIDKKERKRLQEWEINHLKRLKDEGLI